LTVWGDRTGTFGVGITGAGTIAAVYAEALGEIEGTRLVAVSSTCEATDRKLADAHGADWHGELGELLARRDVDAVILCTPSGLHAAEAVAAHTHKHVIAEKPMATTLGDADRMIRACRKAGVTLSVILQYRFNRDALRLKRAVEPRCSAVPCWGTPSSTGTVRRRTTRRVTAGAAPGFSTVAAP
jgi:UDP-N-acetyl-2-amino-2-deoxyglucuronate dehydrogenase